MELVNRFERGSLQEPPNLPSSAAVGAGSNPRFQEAHDTVKKLLASINDPSSSRPAQTAPAPSGDSGHSQGAQIPPLPEYRGESATLQTFDMTRSDHRTEPPIGGPSPTGENNISKCANCPWPKNEQMVTCQTCHCVLHSGCLHAHMLKCNVDPPPQAHEVSRERSRSSAQTRQQPGGLADPTISLRGASEPGCHQGCCGEGETRANRLTRMASTMRDMASGMASGVANRVASPFRGISPGGKCLKPCTKCTNENMILNPQGIAATCNLEAGHPGECNCSNDSGILMHGFRL